MNDFRHHTDNELVCFCRAEPGHLIAEGEIVRRVVADEWDASDLEEKDGKISDLESEIIHLQEKLEGVQEELEDTEADLKIATEEADQLREELEAVKLA